jgi:hypothetical protein
MNSVPLDTIWNDTNRFCQTGYSSPTVWPRVINYVDVELFEEDMAKASERQCNREEWIEDERLEARMNGER